MCMRSRPSRLIMADIFSSVPIIIDMNLSFPIWIFAGTLPNGKAVLQKELGAFVLDRTISVFLDRTKKYGNGYSRVCDKADNRSMQTNYGQLFKTYNPPQTVEFSNVNNKIKFARVVEEPILQLGDFFAYLVLIRAKTHGRKQSRWRSASHKYYNLDHPNVFKRKNCSL